MTQLPQRPTHTGSARQTPRANRTVRVERTTHLTLPNAAIALASGPTSRPQCPVRWARQSLPLGGNKRAVALRLHPHRGMEMLVVGPSYRFWQSAKSLTPAQANRWYREGFEP